MAENPSRGRALLTSPGLRWSILAGVVIVGLVIALASTLGGQTDPYAADNASSNGAQGSGAQLSGEGSDEPRTVLDDQQRAAADLPGCHGTGDEQVSAEGELSQFVVGCMADGEQLTLAELQGGQPLVLNLWAYWCPPCRYELPALQDAQRTLGDDVRIATVHIDASETRGLALLEDLGIDLIAAEDPEKQLPVELGAPPVLPLTVFLRPDGETAHLLVEPMYSEQEVLDAVEEHLGVSA